MENMRQFRCSFWLFNLYFLSCLTNVNVDRPLAVIGGYSETSGLLFASFNTDGSLTKLSGPFDVGPNPTTLTIYDNIPGQYDTIYTVNEFGPHSSLVTIPFDLSHIIPINPNKMVRQSSNGNDPCYITTDSEHKYLYLANYGGAANSSFAVYTIDESTGTISREPIVVKTFDEPSHCHSIVPNPKNKDYFYIADLGRDVVENYEIVYDSDSGKYDAEIRSSLEFEQEAGPRTLFFNPKISGVLYVSREKDNKVSVLSFDETTFELTEIKQTMSTLPSDNTEYSAVSHVQCDMDSKYLYVANRFTNNMAVFQLNDEDGSIVDDSLKINDCGGEIPRFFTIDASNNFLFVCNQEGTDPNVATFQIDHDSNGQLNLVSKFSATRPAWIVLVNETAH